MRWSSVIDQYIAPQKRGRRHIRDHVDFARLVRDEPFGRHEGLIDLRCLDLSGHFVTVDRLELTSADLSDSAFDNARFEQPLWTDLLLARTRLMNSSINGGEIRNCRFHRSQLGGSFLGGSTRSGRRTAYVGCEFVKARTSLQLGDTDFLGCTFDSLMGRMEPGTATFKECRFVGRLHDFEFRTGWPAYYSRRQRRGPEPKNTMKDVDLSQAVLSFVTFEGLDLSAVRLDPSRQFVITDWPGVRARINVPVAVAEEKAGIDWYFGRCSPAIVDLTWVDEQFAPGSADALRRALTQV